MNLKEIAAASGATVVGNADVDITGISYDSRQVRPGHIFAALQGSLKNGQEFLDDAVARGAVAVLSGADKLNRSDVAHVRTTDERKTLAEASAAFHGYPSKQLSVVGITGTNGKTTVSFLVKDILSTAARWPGLLGTVRYEIGERAIPAARTTPESPDLQRMLAEMLRAGCRSAVMEVSSHSLVQKRVWAVDFDVAVFTNLTSDHLDYHGTVEQYFEAKRLLFLWMKEPRGKKTIPVINADDQWGRRLIEQNDAPDAVTFGFSPNAMVRAEGIVLQRAGSSFKVVSPWGDAQVNLQLIGRHNVSNALAAIATGCSLGIPVARAADAVGRRPNVPGRLEEIPTGKSFQVFVDYAHTEDAMRNVLSALREYRTKRLIVVFGCGGNRDRTKRKSMGEVASALADFSIITSDNPRTEDPGQIISEIKSGFSDASKCEVLEDRRAAVRRAVLMAERGDIVLIAGKGHETFQEFANTKVPFDDRLIVKEVLKEQ